MRDQASEWDLRKLRSHENQGDQIWEGGGWDIREKLHQLHHLGSLSQNSSQQKVQRIRVA